MQTFQTVIQNPDELQVRLSELSVIKPGLVLVFAASHFFQAPDFSSTLADWFPNAAVIGCSTAGEISSEGVQHQQCIITAIQFDDTTVVAGSTPLTDMTDSYEAGCRIARQVDGQGLRAVMLFGPGININGSALLKGVSEILGDRVPVTGGLAGDNGAFSRTWTIGPDGVSDQTVVAVGLYGSRLQFSYGSAGGWQSFGPAHKVTRCEGNLLYELDNEPALTVYKSYLGSYADNLPASGLLFPFAMLGENRNDIGLIRTILGVHEEDGSLVLAGEIQPDGYLKMMHATTDALVGGAEAAAQMVTRMCDQTDKGLAILISCIGRKLVMGDRVDDEIEAVSAVLGHRTTLAGFYSYGEIGPLVPDTGCKLHNQTMTISYLAEC